MAWNPFRRNRADTEPTLEVEVKLDDPLPVVIQACGRCDEPYRDSPGNWHVESKKPGLCNVCWYADRDRATRPYSRTKIGFS